MRARAEIIELRDEQLAPETDDSCMVRRMVIQDPGRLFTIAIERTEQAGDVQVGVRVRVGDLDDLDVCSVLHGADVRRLAELPAFVAAAIALAQSRGQLDGSVHMSQQEVRRATLCLDNKNGPCGKIRDLVL